MPMSSLPRDSDTRYELLSTSALVVQRLAGVDRDDGSRQVVASTTRGGSGLAAAGRSAATGSAGAADASAGAAAGSFARAGTAASSSSANPAKVREGRRLMTKWQSGEIVAPWSGRPGPEPMGRGRTPPVGMHSPAAWESSKGRGRKRLTPASAGLP